MNLYVILSFHGMRTGASKPFGSRERRSEEDHCRQICGAKETIKEGTRKENATVSQASAIQQGKKRKILGWDRRLAWSKVPVTITSLASVYGLFSSSLVDGGNAKNTIIDHGSPSENDLMKVLVLCGHDGEIELTRVG